MEADDIEKDRPVDLGSRSILQGSGKAIQTGTVRKPTPVSVLKSTKVMTEGFLRNSAN
jgi:hypothetical protein